MDRSIRALSLAVVAGLALGLGATPAFAADAMSASAIDCTKADTMMGSMKPGGMMHDSAMQESAMHDSAMHDMKPSGSVDKDFARMMMAHHQAMAAMAKVEVACGKDAKSKALAQKMLDQTSVDNAVLEELLKNDAKI